MELGIQPSRCAPTRQRGGKAATGRERDCSASAKSPIFLCKVPHRCGIRHAGLERLPVSSNLNLQLSQAHSQVMGIFVSRTNTPPSLVLVLFPSQFPTSAIREAHISHSPDENLPVFKPSVPFNDY